MPDRAERFDPESVRREWDEASDAYAAMQVDGLDFYRYEYFGPAMVEACKEVAGLSVLDLGCGPGYFSRRMAEQGAEVVGVDISPEQIAHARAREEEEPLGIDYRVLDAASIGEELSSGSFHLVTACVSLQDMPDPEAVIRGAFRVLVPGGRFVATITHPVTDTPFREWIREEDGARRALAIDRYFERGPFVFRWKSARFRHPFWTTGFHAPIEDWTRWFLDAGFVLTGLLEPRPTGEALANRPELGDAARVPYFLTFLLSRPAGSTPPGSGPRSPRATP